MMEGTPAKTAGEIPGNSGGGPPAHPLIQHVPPAGLAKSGLLIELSLH